MDQIALHLLGSPRVEYGGRPIALRLQKELALLIYLVEQPQEHIRLALATLLWPEQDQSAALAGLRRTIYQLKADIGENVLQTTSHTVCLRSDLVVWRDTHDFLVAANHCASHTHPPDALTAACLSALGDATALYKDDFLAGFSLPDCPMFDEWQFFAREEFRAMYLHILTVLAACYERGGDYPHGIEMARLLLSREPTHEPAHRALIRMYAMDGQVAAARRQYETCKRILADQLGVQPDEETERLILSLGASTSPIITRSQTHYVRSGEAYIAYQTIGAGAPDIVQIGGFISHVEQLWEEPDLARFSQQLGNIGRVIVYDKRGMGLSDRVSTQVDVDQHVGDIQTVMQATEVKRAVVFAVSEGASVGIEMVVRHPERIAALIIYGGQAKGVRSADYPWGLAPEQYQRWADKLVKGWGEPVNLEYFTPTRAHDERFRQWWAQTQRLAASPGAVKAILEGIRETDVRSLLPQIRVPALVLHRRGDRSVPVESGRYLASHIPGARYVELPGEDHWWWVGDTKTLLDEIERFIRQVSR